MYNLFKDLNATLDVQNCLEIYFSPNYQEYVLKQTESTDQRKILRARNKIPKSSWGLQRVQSREKNITPLYVRKKIVITFFSKI